MKEQISPSFVFAFAFVLPVGGAPTGCRGQIKCGYHPSPTVQTRKSQASRTGLRLKGKILIIGSFSPGAGSASTTNTYMVLHFYGNRKDVITLLRRCYSFFLQIKTFPSSPQNEETESLNGPCTHVWGKVPVPFVGTM